MKQPRDCSAVGVPESKIGMGPKVLLRDLMSEPSWLAARIPSPKLKLANVLNVPYSVT